MVHPASRPIRATECYGPPHASVYVDNEIAGRMELTRGMIESDVSLFNMTAIL